MILRGFAMSQRVAFALAERMPRVEAEALVKQVSAEALAADMSFAEALAANPETAARLDSARIELLLDPSRMENPAIEQVERVLEEAGQ